MQASPDGKRTIDTFASLFRFGIKKRYCLSGLANTRGFSGSPDSTKKDAKIVFYDEMGRAIKEVVLEQKGNGSVIANSAKLTSGIYSYSIVVEGKMTDTKKMMKSK